jgi:DnaK suppressor protein
VQLTEFASIRTILALKFPTPFETFNDVKKPTKKSKSFLDVKERNAFKKMLLELRARLSGDVNMMAQEALSGGTDGLGSLAPTHMADLGTDAYSQEFTLSMMQNDGDRLQQVQDALERIAEGKYGACVECEGRIPKARLEVLPDTPYCVKCAAKPRES